MQCEHARELLDAGRYGDAAALDAAAPHIAECAECRVYGERAERLDRLLSVDEAVEPRPGFDSRFFARLEELKALRSHGWLRRFRWYALSLTAAAAVAALVLAVAPMPETTIDDDLELVLNLELAKDLDIVQKLEEIEVYELLAQVDLEEMGQIIGNEVPR